MQSVPSKLSAEKRVLFQEMIWRLMGNLQDTHWRDMLDPTTPMATSNSPTYGQSNSSMQDGRIMRHRR